MDFVHDTLADGRPFRVLTVVDNWSRHSPVLEAGFRISGETVGRALDGVLGEGPGPRSITVDHGTEFQSRALEELGLSLRRSAGFYSTRQTCGKRLYGIL